MDQTRNEHIFVNNFAGALRARRTDGIRHRSHECSAREGPGGSTGSPSREAATTMRIFVHTGLVTLF